MQLVDIALVMVFARTPSRFCRCRRLRFHYIHPNRRIRLSHSYRAGYGTGGDVLLVAFRFCQPLPGREHGTEDGAVVGLAGAAGAWVSSGWSSLIPEDKLGFMTSGMLFASGLALWFRMLYVSRRSEASGDSVPPGGTHDFRYWYAGAVNRTHNRLLIGAVRNRLHPFHPVRAYADPRHVDACCRRHDHAGHYANRSGRRSRVLLDRVPGCSTARRCCDRYDVRLVCGGKVYEAGTRCLAENLHGPHPMMGAAILLL